MANIVLAVNSDWSTCSDNNNTGSAPAAGDNIYLNGKNLTLDGADASTYTCALIKGCAANGTTAAAGIIVLANATSTINANITAGTQVSLTVAADKTVTVNGTVTGGASAYINGVTVSGGNLVVTALVGGGTSAYGYGGRITSGVITVTNATGGGWYYCHGLQVEGGTSTVANAKGGTHASACGVGSQATSGTCTITGADLTGTGLSVGCVGAGLRVAAGVKLSFPNASGTMTKYYDPTLMPAIADVRKNTAYAGADLTGGCYVPAAAGVLSGVNVDATQGTFDEAARNVDPGVTKVMSPAAGGPAHYHIQGSELIGTASRIIIED